MSQSKGPESRNMSCVIMSLMLDLDLHSIVIGNDQWKWFCLESWKRWILDVFQRGSIFHSFNGKVKLDQTKKSPLSLRRCLQRIAPKHGFHIGPSPRKGIHLLSTECSFSHPRKCKRRNRKRNTNASCKMSMQKFHAKKCSPITKTEGVRDKCIDVYCKWFLRVIVK